MTDPELLYAKVGETANCNSVDIWLDGNRYAGHAVEVDVHGGWARVYDRARDGGLRRDAPADRPQATWELVVDVEL